MAKTPRKCYVLDTNILIDYVDIIPKYGAPHKELEDPTIDLSGAHIVVPSVVIRELSNFKKERSERGKAARIASKRIRDWFENQEETHTMGQAYKLQAAVEIKQTGQLLSVLPVHKDFKKVLPFSPSNDDMDGQIILATIAASYALSETAIDGTTTFAKTFGSKLRNVVLLTNDNGLAIRAMERGITTSRFGYKYPPPYTGRRDIEVPSELFKIFYTERGISREKFEELMPKEPKLVANEFIVMSVANRKEYPNTFDDHNNPYFENIGRYDYREDAIVPLRYVSGFPVSVRNPGQAIYAEALMDPTISAVICTGPAGSGKTYMSTIYGYAACKKGEYTDVIAVPCENRSNIGALPGDLDEKMDPDVRPLKNAIRNYLLDNDPKFRKELANMKKFGVNDEDFGPNEDGASHKASLRTRVNDRVDLIWSNWFASVPVELARGLDFEHELTIYDEFQDQSETQADTLIKRIGQKGKIILTGDVKQIHAPYLGSYNNGLIYASRQLYNDPMVAQVCFTPEEVVRHPLVKMIAERQKARELSEKSEN